jgi:hypothetical protein
MGKRKPTKKIVFQETKSAYWYAKDILSLPSKRVVYKNNLQERFVSRVN